METDYFIRDVELSLLAALPETTKPMSRLDVYLREGTRVMVKGYGKPFANPDHPSHGWMNQNEPVVGDSTLVDILEQRNFSFVVVTGDLVLAKHWSQELPGPFRYPYGDEHSWSLERYDEQLLRNRGPQFAPAFSFDNDNEHLAAMTQSQVQDVMWIHKAAQDIADIRFRAYFINANEGARSDEFYVVVLLDDGFMRRFKDTWQHLVKGEFLQLKMFDGPNDETPASWDAMIIDHPKGLPAMAGHQTDKDDFVLRVRRPLQSQPQRRPDFDICVFSDRKSANRSFGRTQYSWNSVSLEFNPHLKECKRNVDAVCMFHPQAQPSNLVAVSQDVRFRMALHRALLRGNGFYDVLVRGTDDGPYDVDSLASDFEHAHLGDNRAPRSLPVVNLLDLDYDHLTALLQDILPEDRQRFYNYMAERPLGLGCISAGPGFGKTTVISVATIGMNATLGKIYAVAPSHVAVDTFAERLARISQNVAARCNRDKERGDRTRTRRVLVLRGYKFGDEYDAFWLLMVLRSPAQMQRDMDSRSEFGRFCAVATGSITWEEYQRGETVPQGFVTGMFLHLVKQADILCTTPALSCTLPYRTWKEESARGIAVDEAGNISRPDLYTAWGNTLLPCLLSGDEKQLRPNIMTLIDHDADHNAINRFAPDGLISPLEFFTATGWPIYRLRVQLRMARGLFDMCHREVYNDLPFTYGVGSNIARHGVGVTLENYLARRFPGLAPPRHGMLSEVFVHCQGTVCSVHGLTKSKRNMDQVENALDFLRDFVQTTAIDASRLAIITPYKANVEYIARRRRDPRYAILADMRPAATVDSSQGSEAEIIVAIFGTTSAVGPGFTVDEHRLNVMLSRQKSGLLIFGDINVMGPVNAPIRGKTRLDFLLEVFNHCLHRGHNVRCNLHKYVRLLTHLGHLLLQVGSFLFHIDFRRAAGDPWQSHLHQDAVELGVVLPRGRSLRRGFDSGIGRWAFFTTSGRCSVTRS
ncbi:P-loop containing nucleoside triphosphate hydrolase protein [Trichoderma sp. SZMC 28012]